MLNRTFETNKKFNTVIMKHLRQTKIWRGMKIQSKKSFLIDSEDEKERERKKT